MNLSEEAIYAFNNAVNYAAEEKYEYVTPEMLLLMLCRNRDFAEAFEACGGDLKMLEADLLTYIGQYMEKTDEGKPTLTEGIERVLMLAAQSAFNSGCNEVEVRHLVHGLWQLEECYAVYYMEKQGIAESEILEGMSYSFSSDDEPESITLAELMDMPTSFAPDQAKSGDQGSGWQALAPCLNDTLKDVNPLIGREKELERTIQILCRKDKNNPLHIGESGVGKTAITYGLVQRIVSGQIPDALKGAKIFALDLGGMIAGTQYRGEFEKRIKRVLAEIGKEEKPVIYIDEIHNLVGAGAVGEGTFDAANLLKSYLTDGHIRFIGATTFEEYKKYFEKNRSLIRRFQNVEIPEPTEAETVRILEGLKKKYEKYHGVRYQKGLMEYIVRMSAKYINDRFLPDKAIDLMDEAGSYRKLHPLQQKTQTVDRALINAVLTGICRVPVESVKTDDTSGLVGLETALRKQIFGQDQAVRQVVNAVKFSRAGLLEEGKPLASLLFVGPTGVGKTEIARVLAELLGMKLIRFDMSEYGEKYAVSKLIGASAGYVGYEEGGLLTEAIRKAPSAVLLLDEIEKAHADIYNILLQVMDYATLTDNQGRKADFRNVILIMTSNAGANRVGRAGIGFQAVQQDDSAMLEEVRRIFQPEFRNRLNKTVVFNSMDDHMAELVVAKKLAGLGERLKLRGVRLQVNDEAKALVKKRGISQEFGAREADRVIRNDIMPLFVDELLFGKLKKGGELSLFVKDGEFAFRAVKGSGKQQGGSL